MMKKMILALASVVLGMAGAVSQTTMENMKPINPEDAVVEIKTTMGDITVEIYNDTPLHRDNFLKLVNEGFYDGVLFHRVIDSFMIQTGDPMSKNAAPGVSLGSGDPGYTIAAEIDYPHHYHKKGALAAARTGDAYNPERRSSGSQFYIVTGRIANERQLEAMDIKRKNSMLESTFRSLSMDYRDSIISMQKAGDETGLEALRQKLIAETEAKVKPMDMPENIKKDYVEKGGTPHLDGQYTVFGEVIGGLDVVDKIQKVETDDADRPKEDVRIISARVLSK